MKKPGKISLKATLGSLGGSWHHFELPEGTASHFGGSFPIRVICTVNKSLRFHCALMSMGNARSFITLSKAKMKEAGLKEGDSASLVLEADTSKYGMEMPEELSTLLEQDDEGRRRFDMLSAGKQRNIIHHVSSVKNQQKKIDRAIMLIESLKTIPENTRFTFFDILYPEKREF